MTTVHRPWCLVLIVIAMASVALLPSPALGQGTDRALPDPIAGGDVTTYGRILGLSDEQRLAVDGFHEQYLNDFRVLRDNEIQRYLNESSGRMRMMFFAPDAKEIERQLNDLERVMSRIRSLDERLFDQTQTVLSEDQIARMPRVREVRARQRYRSGMVRVFSFSNPGSRVDLSELLAAMELSADQATAVDAVQSDYERQLTVRLRSLYEGTQKMYEQLARRSEELADLAQPPPGEIGREQRFPFDRMRDIMAEAGKEAREAASAISRLNVRFFQTFRNALDDESGRELMSGYFEVAYRDVHYGMSRALNRYDEALRLEGLTEDHRGMIENAREDLQSRHETVAWQMIDITEEIRRESGLFGFGPEEDPAKEEKLDRLREQRDEMNEKALAALESMLGSTLAEKLEEMDGNRSRRSVETVAVMIGDGGGGVVALSGDASRVMLEDAPLDPFLPGPISVKELDHYAQILRLSDDQRVVLESVHEMYLERWEMLRTEQLEPLQEAQRALWSFDREARRMTAPSDEALEEVYKLRESSLQKIIELDRSLFDDVALAVLADEEQVARLPRARLARERVVYNRRGGGGGFFPGPPGGAAGPFGGGGGESTIDLTLLLSESQIEDTPRDEIETKLGEYEAQLTDAFRNRYRLLVSERKAADQMSRQSVSEEGGGARRSLRMAVDSEAWEAVEGIRGERRGIERAIVELNRSALESVRSLLPDPVATDLQGRYSRQGFPAIYDDDRAVHDDLQDALGLTDLTENQRSEIASQFGEYRSAYEVLCLKMIELEADEDETGGRRDPEVWRRRQEVRNAQDRIRFDREELNDRTRRRLQSILSEVQAREIGLIEEAEGF